jgi:predicted secreted Zn-dependent protease
MGKEEETHKKTDVKPAENSKEQNPKSIRRQVCCCLSILSVFIAISLLITIRMFCDGGESKIPVFNTNKTVTAPTTTTKNYPVPNSCEPMSASSVLPLAISTDSPGLHQKTDNHYYQIYAYTKNDIYDQINTCGPIVDEQAYFGLAKSYLNWTYNYTYVGDSCNVKDVAVGVHTEIYYPKLEVLSGGESGLAAKWDDYIPKLVLHEEGHRDNAINAGNQILSAVSALPTLSCASMQEQVNNTADNIMTNYNATDASYDDSTNHGQTQGADF